MNVLSTDITDQNIEFEHDNIDNEYIQEISLEDMYDIFKKDNISVFTTKYNTMNAISLVLDNGAEISLYEYEKNMNPLFLKISNNDLRKEHAEILIYMPENHLMTEKIVWQTIYKQIQSNIYVINDIKFGDTIAEYDFDGYGNCQRISKIVKDNPELGEIPAIDYCMKQNIHGYKGYLPAMGQLRVIADYRELINYILSACGCSEINSEEWILSSTEHSNEHVWMLFGNVTQRHYKSIYNYSVLPVFKKI